MSPDTIVAGEPKQGKPPAPYVTFEDGIITIAGTQLPGLLRSLSVTGQVKFDEAETDGQSGKKRTPLGYEDAIVNVEMELLTDEEDAEQPTDCYQKLEALERLFKDVGAKAAPKLLTVVNRHLRARHIEQVYFSGLVSREGNQDDTIIAALTFTEYMPPVTTAEKRVVKAALKAQEEKAAAAEAVKNSAPPADVDREKLKIDTN